MTAITPTRRVLVSMPLIVTLTVLTVAAARTPSPRPGLLRRHASIAPASRTSVEYTPAATHNTATGPAAHDIPPVDAASARHLPRLAASESLPLISATWENASLEDVVAALAKFSHRRITIAPDVSGVVTATVVDQPWRAALEMIMARQGLQVEFRGDSTVYISRQQESAPRRREINEAVQVSRTVSGTVDDAQTGAPISNAQITFVGGGANASDDSTLQNVPQFYDHGRRAALSDEAGRFGLRVPSGEVTLQACAAGYEFRRITLGPTDSIAEFHGDRTGQHSQDTVRISRKDIASIEIMKGQAATALYGAAAANGVIELTMKDGTVTHIPVGSEGPTPVLIIDGKVAHDCATERWWIHFQPF